MEEDIKVLEEYLNYEVTKRKLSGCEILAIENLIARNKELEEMNKKLESRKYMLNAETGEVTAIPIDNNYIPKSKVIEKIDILEKCTTNIDRKVNLTDYMIIGETERAVGRFVNLDFIKKVLLEEPGYDIELLQEGDK